MNRHRSDGGHVVAQIRGRVGCITLNRSQALNALSLSMVRDLTSCLLAWRDDARVLAVAVRGMSKHGAFGAFCAGGDIRFFHQAALSGDPALEDFFTEEYALNHLIHRYPKPTVAFMDGVVMGGGMGIAQGTRYRIVTERTRMAMPETAIGLFPDVGGGYFLSRCPGRVGEYLALTGEVIGATAALHYGLADAALESSGLEGLWDTLATRDFADAAELTAWLDSTLGGAVAPEVSSTEEIDRYFGLPDLPAMVHALQDAGPSTFEQQTLKALRKSSPLMLSVTLEQIRRARHIGLADDLRMERDLVRHCFHLRRGAASETVEGIRALAIDKDHSPRWNPPQLEEVTPEMVHPFFTSPWPAHAHPLRALSSSAYNC